MLAVDRGRRSNCRLGSRARAIPAPGEPGQRREHRSLHPARRERCLHLLLELAHEQSELERLRDATQHRASLLGEADGGLEQLLHLKGGSDLDGRPTTLLCGAVRFDHPAARNLIAMLPAIIHVQAGAPPHTDWMPSTLRLMAAEARQLRPGGEAVITRLGDILVIQAIRSWIDTDPAARTGWLGALQDPRSDAPSP